MITFDSNNIHQRFVNFLLRFRNFRIKLIDGCRIYFFLTNETSLVENEELRTYIFTRYYFWWSLGEDPRGLFFLENLSLKYGRGHWIVIIFKMMINNCFILYLKKMTVLFFRTFPARIMRLHKSLCSAKRMTTSDKSFFI